jgi:hypothetical protein
MFVFSAGVCGAAAQAATGGAAETLSLRAQVGWILDAARPASMGSCWCACFPGECAEPVCASACSCWCSSQPLHCVLWQGHFVRVMGDGLKDAHALVRADMMRSWAVAPSIKHAADMLLVGCLKGTLQAAYKQHVCCMLGSLVPLPRAASMSARTSASSTLQTTASCCTTRTKANSSLSFTMARTCSHSKTRLLLKQLHEDS